MFSVGIFSLVFSYCLLFPSTSWGARVFDCCEPWRSADCCDLGSPRAVHHLKNLVKIHTIHILFLTETKSSTQYMGNLRVKLGFSNCFTVSSVGLQGGLYILWSNSLNFYITAYSFNFIDGGLLSTTQVDLFSSQVSMVSQISKKWIKFWEAFKSVHALPFMLWVCIGDFNQISSAQDKQGGVNPNLTLCNYFNSITKELQLRNIHFNGHKFTGKRGDTLEHLDEAMCTLDWLNMFPSALCPTSPLYIFWSSPHAFSYWRAGHKCQNNKNVVLWKVVDDSYWL